MIKIRAFQAISDEESCKKYFEGHMEVLRVFNITNITTANTNWFYEPSVYVVVAEQDDKIVGGVRIHLVDNVTPLPVETAVGMLDARLADMVAESALEGSGEACGQWNSREVAGLGLSTMLIRSAISIANQINTKWLWGIAAEYTLPMFGRVGYHPVSELGNNGEFIYPNSNYRAKVIRLNSETLEYADAVEREAIFELRKSPSVKRIENGTKTAVEVQYELTVGVLTN